jgi:hypothetical protein
MIQGAYLIPPFGKYEMAAEIVEAIKAKDRSTAGA